MHADMSLEHHRCAFVWLHGQLLSSCPSFFFSLFLFGSQLISICCQCPDSGTYLVWAPLAAAWPNLLAAAASYTPQHSSLFAYTAVQISFFSSSPSSALLSLQAVEVLDSQLSPAALLSCLATSQLRHVACPQIGNSTTSVVSPGMCLSLAHSLSFCTFSCSFYPAHTHRDTLTHFLFL